MLNFMRQDPSPVRLCFNAFMFDAPSSENPFSRQIETNGVAPVPPNPQLRQLRVFVVTQSSRRGTSSERASLAAERGPHNTVEMNRKQNLGGRAASLQYGAPGRVSTFNSLAVTTDFTSVGSSKSRCG